jgi:heme/copper-type cytochrome/quinol oxidase subunit 3
MATITAPDMRAESFSGVPAPQPRRPRVLLTGTVLAATGAAAAIAGLVALYARLRADFLAGAGEGETWLRDAHIELTPGNVAIVTLVMSAVTAAAAGWSLRRNDRGHAMMSLGTTLMLGAAYITTTAYAWQQLDAPIIGAGPIMDATAGSPALLIVVITAAHVAMTAAGMLYLLVMGFKALGGQLTGRAAEGYNAAVAYWFITIAVYAVVWHTIFVTK